VDVISLDGAATDADWLVEYDDTAVDVAVTADDLAYVLYTSGSTGTPKGVMVPHGALANYLDHATKQYLDDTMRGAVVSSPLGFDATLTTLLPALLAGKQVELLPDGDALLEALSARLYDDTQPQLFKITPAHLEALGYLAEGRVGHAAHRIVVGGEQLSVAMLQQWKGERLPQAWFVNEYGPTETVVGCSVFEVATQAQLQALSGRSAVPIGRPIQNTQLYVLGEGMQLQPEGSLGELYIGGDGVTRGYLNRDELTAERFVANPFGEGRLYRSGDLVRWLADGELAFEGRRDEQVKIRGFRIELGEIESVLRSVDGVREAVAVARNDGPQGEKRLVAYVVSSAESASLITTCREAAQSRLPDYMIPSAFVVVDALPLTANGKVDRKALPAPEASEAVAYRAPRNAIEQALCDVWQEVLRREQVGIADNFFSLGGDSILSIRIVSLLKARGLQIAIKDIFQHQTIEQLAPSVVSETSVEETLEPFALLTADERQLFDDEVEDAYPLSALQAGMVFHTQLEQFSGIYHDIMADHVRCRWDREAFEQALVLCIAEHPILRSGFRLDGERPLQFVRRQGGVPLQVEDLRSMPEAEQDAYLVAWTETHKHHVFDWEHGPLFQIHVFRRSDDSFQFVISFHHAVLDGWSRAALTTSLYNRYEQLLAGERPEAPAVDWTYRRFVAQEQAVLADPAAKEHFARTLEEAPGQQIPHRRERSERGQGYRVEPAFFELSAPLVALARELGVPVQVVLLAAHLKALSTVSGLARAMTAVTQNGRPEREGGERALGLFLNSVPMGLSLEAGSWRELVQRVAALNTATLGWRSYPLSKIQQDLGREFSEVLFNYTHFHVFAQMSEGDRTSGSGLEVLGSSGFEQTNFGLLVDVARGLEGDGLRLAFVYDTGQYDEATIASLSGYFVTACERMLADLEASHAKSLLSEAERRKLAEFNATTRAFPRDVRVHELFEEQVGKDPQAVAVTFEGQSLSYSELDEKANQLARYLMHECGVGRNDLVGLCMERSLEMVIGLLAALKAGGAYVPLDPSYPQQRLAHMVQDSGVKRVLMQRRLLERVPVHESQVVCLDTQEVQDKLSGYAQEKPQVQGASARDLAYVIYTSGSTGLPKGVLVEHQALMNRIDWMHREYGADASDTFLQKTPFGFDVSVWEFVWPLMVGSRMVMARPDGHKDPDYLAGVISEEGVTKLHFVPSMLSSMLANGGLSNCMTLRQVFCSGEALAPQQVSGFFEQCPWSQLHNLYGPTEAAIDVSYWDCSHAQLGGTNVPIGRPIQNIQLHVLSEGGNLAPVGATGELCIAGLGLARGYLNRPELTQEKFVANPFHDEMVEASSDRMYRTGDLARWRDDGVLEFLGRIDHQVKVRGFRIELGEIEAVLAACDGVREVVVLARDEVGDKRLVAYFTGTVSVPILKERLSERLPDYMVPSAFVALDALPLTPNGKVDRKALPAPGVAALRGERLPPQTVLEAELLDVVAELLKLDPESISVDADFFELGGHSLMLMRLQARLRDVFGVGIDIRLLHEKPDIRSLAAVVDASVMKKQLAGNLASLGSEQLEEIEF
jgi:amino acid adenylation domain-containing protein